MGITEIPGPDLCTHVPAVEGACGELEATRLQQHVGHGRQGIPLQLQLPEPFVPVRWEEPAYSFAPNPLHKDTISKFLPLRDAELDAMGGIHSLTHSSKHIL